MILFTFIIILISFQFVLIMSSVWHTIYSFLWSYEPSLDPENSYNDYENIQTDPIELAPVVIVLRDASTMSNIVLKDSSTSLTQSNHELMYASNKESDVSKLSGGVTAAKLPGEDTAYKIWSDSAAKSTEEDDDSDDEFIKALPMTTCDLL